MSRASARKGMQRRAAALESLRRAYGLRERPSVLDAAAAAWCARAVRGGR